MRIAFVQFYFYPDISAVSQMLFDLIEEISKDKSLKITVFSGRSRYQRKKTIEQTHNVLRRISVKRIFTFNFGKINFLTRMLDYSFYYLYVFFYFLFSRKWDVIVGLTSPPLIGFCLALALFFRKTKFINYVQDLYPDLLYDLGIIKSSNLTRRCQLLNRITFRRSDKIIAIGDYMAEKIARSNRKIRSKIEIIDNWAKDIKFFNTVDERNGFNIVYSGNIGISHDFTLLNNILPLLKRYSEIKFIFIGEGANKKNVQKIFQNSKYHNVNFLGYSTREDIELNLKNADVLLISQRKEVVGDILPSKFYAYLAAGRPILFFGARNSEIGEIILSQKIGMVCESIYDLSNTVKYLIFLKECDKAKRVIGSRVRSLYEKKYNFDSSVRKFIKIIGDVTGNEK